MTHTRPGRGQSPVLPTGAPVVREVDGLLEVGWPQGKPVEGWFAITPELFIEMVDQINEGRRR